MIGTLLFTAWCKVVRNAGATWSNIPILNRIPLPKWMQSKVDAAIDDALKHGED